MDIIGWVSKAHHLNTLRKVRNPYQIRLSPGRTNALYDKLLLSILLYFIFALFSQKEVVILREDALHMLV